MALFGKKKVRNSGPQQPRASGQQGNADPGKFWTTALAADEFLALLRSLFGSMGKELRHVGATLVADGDAPNAALMVSVYGTPLAIFPPPTPADALVFLLSQVSEGTRIGVVPYGNAHFGTIFDVLMRLQPMDSSLAESGNLSRGWVAVTFEA